MDDPLEERLRKLAAEYHLPPETPREEMWEKISAARREQGKVLPLRRATRPAFRRPFRWAAGIAAVLALGIGVGRLSVRQAPAPTATPVAAVPASPLVNVAAYRMATTEHLGQSEAFLTLFKAAVKGQTDERLASATARQLLATNRLLLDSPAADDRSTKLLLQDLELVLAEIAQLSPAPRSHDLDLITQGLEQGGVLSRLRTAVPAGTSPTRGAL
jgi:hypothetical protein